MNKQYGFIKPTIEKKDYVFGGGNVINEIINPTGQWLNFLPEKENQVFNNRDSFACATYGSLNCVETLLKLKNKYSNKSDRFVAIGSGTKIGIGNDPQKVAEFIRNNGVCNEELLSINTIKTIEEFYQPNPLTSDLKIVAEKFMFEFDFFHEYVFQDNCSLQEKQDRLKHALMVSPVGISVSAWFQRNGKFYKPQGMNDNHWVELVGYRLNDCWIIFDSSDQEIKELEWDYDFEIAKVYHLHELTPEESEQKRKEMLGVLEKWLNLLMEWAKSLFMINTLDIKQTPQIEPVLPQIEPSTEQKYDEFEPIIDFQYPQYKWDNPIDARHSVRVICDEMGLSFKDKNLICAVIDCESEFKINAKNINKTSSGNIHSTDYGICQFNDYWYRNLITPEEAENDPEKAVRLMIDVFKGKIKGYNINNWICYRKLFTK